MTKAAQTLVRLVLSGEKHRLDKEILSKYEWLDEDYFLDERTRVRLHEKEGYVDTEGNEIGSIKYDETDIFNEGFAGVCVDDKWGFINKQGEEICPLIYDEVRFFQFGRAAVCREGLWGFIDEQGEEVIPCVFGEKIILLTKKLSEPEWKTALQRIKKTMGSQVILRELLSNPMYNDTDK